MAPKATRKDLDLSDTPALSMLQERPEDFPGIEAFDLATCQDFLRVAKRALAAFGDVFAQRGISPGRYSVLMELRRADGELAPSVIADRIGVTRATVTGLIDGLMRDGLVTRSGAATTADRRRRAIRLSPSGKRLLDELLPPLFGHMAGLVGPLSPRERSTFRRLLRKLEAAIEDLKGA